MNAKIKKLMVERMKLASQVGELEAKLQVAWNELFEKSPYLAAALRELENSKNYSLDEHGEIIQWIGFKEAERYSHCREYFEAWIGNEMVCVDWENSNLQTQAGPSLVIYADDGSVYDQDSGKTIINKRDYLVDGEPDEELRDSLIEAWMTKTGYFPGVFRADEHGNIFLHNTHRKLEVLSHA